MTAMKRLHPARGARVLGAAVLIGGAASTANAQWTVVSLHPAGATSSRAYDTDGSQQVGEATVGELSHASLWTGSAASWVDLNPPVPGSYLSLACGVRDGQQVGVAFVGGSFQTQAILWSGSAASWESLHPPRADFSVGLGGGAGQQVGYARFGLGTPVRGILWGGTAGSFVDLHPGGVVTETWAKSAHGGQQVGSAVIGGIERSSLWMGTAASWMDMTPPGQIASTIEHVHDGHQVGMVVVNGEVHAALWNNTPQSWVDLNPAGSNHSRLYGVYGDQQVGYVWVGGARHAGLWSGTAASWVDLHAFLPADFTWSEARAIWKGGAVTQVVGFGLRTTPYHHEAAVMWVSAPPCYADCDQNGTLNIDDFLCFQLRFALQDPYADCDGNSLFNIDDFLCFQLAFALGCP